ncbi:hypothetical protein FRC06_007982, partial [Ceratobasidium sp. 370]
REVCSRDSSDGSSIDAPIAKEGDSESESEEGEGLVFDKEGGMEYTDPDEYGEQLVDEEDRERLVDGAEGGVASTGAGVLGVGAAKVRGWLRRQAAVGAGRGGGSGSQERKRKRLVDTDDLEPNPRGRPRPCLQVTWDLRPPENKSRAHNPPKAHSTDLRTVRLGSGTTDARD